MSFQFRFDSILQLRRRQRDEAGGALGKAIEAIRRIEEQIEGVQDQRTSLSERQTLDRVGQLSVDALLSTGRYDLQLQADLTQLASTRRELVQEMERRRAVLATANAELKRFERLEEKERATHHAMMIRREQNEADDRSSQAYLLAQRRSRS